MTYTVSSDYRASGNTNGKRFGWICGVCLHHSAGTTLDLVPTFKQNVTSAHYGIKDKEVRQFVPDNKTVWATGTSKGNNLFINIECVNSDVNDDWPIDESTVDTLCEFLADKAKEWGIKKYKAGANLKGHRDFYNTYCPGVLYARLPEIADRANKLMQPKGWDEMATKEEIEAVCFEAAKNAVWDQRENIADTIFARNVEGKPFYWLAAQGADAAWAANEALHVGDPTGRTEMPVLEQVRYMAQKQANMQTQLDHIEEMLEELVK